MGAIRWVLVGTVIATGSVSAMAPVLARENGLTCAEKYHAAMATGKLKHGVTKSVFMERCVSETRNERERHKSRPRRS
ncbi:MAG: hypothetical protein ACTHJV_05175 [Rhizobiaceae bacterium]